MNRAVLPVMLVLIVVGCSKSPAVLHALFPDSKLDYSGRVLGPVRGCGGHPWEVVYRVPGGSEKGYDTAMTLDLPVSFQEEGKEFRFRVVDSRPFPFPCLANRIYPSVIGMKEVQVP
ncbi:hypothetical protein KTO58_22705 [Chitinophaga pendula]|uniref:hypothetical protein n=1 Tax=Chitinophaga TaxID=79328 RepID=UPI000BAF44DE|nr:MULTISPECIES: hypothetical protein [Chitinophaga]ASZ10573.1 hypothetical protein CK934_06070 [Chitinophaga sp. MD30]UCJ06453.1 hypothetical protein KTO58_22705 [Chitinophaga pendula]